MNDQAATPTDTNGDTRRRWILIGCAVIGGVATLGLVCVGALLLWLVVVDSDGAPATAVMDVEPSATAVSTAGSDQPGSQAGSLRHRPVPGAGVALDFPDEMQQVDADADEMQGTWWFQSEAGGSPRVILSAVRWEEGIPYIDDDYLRSVVEEIEVSSGNRDVEYELIVPVEIDGYEGRRVSYWAVNENDEREYTAAVLIAREEDDLFVAVYGPASQRQAIDVLASRIFDSMAVDPTPATYIVQGV